MLTTSAAVAVMFTFSFGSAFAATPNDNAADSQAAFNKVVTDTLNALSYDGDGYVTNAEKVASDLENSVALNNTISKTAIESYSAMLQSYYLSKIGSVNSNWDAQWSAVSNKTAYAKALLGWNNVNKELGTGVWAIQADLDTQAAYAALAPDLSGYSAKAKAEVEKVIDAQTDVLEKAIATYKTDQNTGNMITSARDVVAAVKAALKANDTTADDTKAIEKAKNAAVNALNDKAPDFLDAAEDAYKGATDRTSAARYATLNDDYDKMVKYFEDVIATTALDEDDESMDTAAEVVAEFAAIKGAIEWTFNKNALEQFYQNLGHLKDADLYKSLAEKNADAAKVARKADGTLLHYAKDVEKALDDALNAIDKALRTGIVHGGDGNWAKLNASLATLQIGNGTYALKAYKNDAIKAITEATYALDKWSGERADKVEALQDDYTDKILMAETVADVDAFVKEAKDAMDALLRQAQIDALNTKTENRMKALGYEDVLSKYYDAVVGSKGYTATTRADAIDNAKKLIKDAVIAKENAKLTYAEIDQIIKENRDAAIAKVTDVKTKAELKTMADALVAQFKALPTTVTLADKDTILAAQKAFDEYLALAGTTKGDVNNAYLLANAMTSLMNLEVKAVNDQIRALPKTVTIADAKVIEEARAAYKALETTYGAYDNETGAKEFNYLGAAIQTRVTRYSTLTSAEDALEKARIADAAAKVTALTVNSTVAEIEAAKAAYDALKLTSKLEFNDELHAKLVNAVNGINKIKVEAVTSLKIKASSKASKGAMTIKWRVIYGDKKAASGYQVWRSTKANKGFKKMITTKKMTYKNTKNLKKGTTYYYRVRAYARVDGKLYFSDFSNKAYRKAK